jgi:NAD(P)-dependent dehydrogenase (short-subunit alcohol dehydrogenase family)
MTDWTFDSIPPQTGRTAIVTGANTGIGYETALALARKGAHVILACRDMQKAEAAAERIAGERPAGSARARQLDLSDLESVRRFSEGFAAEHKQLDLLIANAGVMVPPYSKTAQGFELQFGTNHLGHFALAAQLLPLLRRTPGARLVVVSSGVHHGGRIDFDDLNCERKGYSAWRAYAQSKLANLLFALELQRRLAAAGDALVVTAAHPGYTATDLQRTAGLARLMNPLFGMRPPQGALPTLRAATDPGARAGDYFGPRRFFEMNGPPELARINRRARDLEVAARLWQVSEALTGVHFDLDTRAAAA